MSLTAAEDTHIYLYDAEQDAFTKSVALWRSGLRTPTASQTQHGALIDRVRRTGRSMVIDDIPHHELYATSDAIKTGSNLLPVFP